MSDLPILPERYRGVRLLGEGATGSVYEADDRLVGRKVALKIVRPNLAIHARFRARFAHEVALSARVVHPRVVPVHDYGRLPDNRPFVSLAFADRGSFDDLLEQRPALNEALRLIDQVLDALSYLHARGLLHQDLKPGNVLLHAGPGGRTDAWVADLGVTEALTVLAMDRRGIAGTPGWMAPEQLMGRAQELGPWTDLYAVGLMLYAMLGGNIRAEAAEEARGDLLKQRLQLRVKLRPEIPRALGEVVSNLLDPEPRQRYDRAADVRRALNHAVAVMPAGVGARGIHQTKFRRSTTSFAHTFLPEGRAHFIAPQQIQDLAAEYRWNRVALDPMPHPVPVEAGLDSPGRASLALIALREPPLVGRHEVRQRLWTMARDVVRTGAPQVALVIGEAGTGKSRVVSSVAETLDQHGYMESITLRYHNPPGPDDGYRGAVRELLSPWNDTRPELEERLTRWLARDWGVPRESVVEEAGQLARWCGMLREGEAPIHAAAGLAYLYRYLDVRGWRGGAALVLEDAHQAQAAGDGLAICEALLRRTVGERPVLAIATLSADAVANNPALAGVVEDLIMLGAQRVDVSPLASDEIQRLLTEAYLLEPSLAAAVAPSCQGSPSYATLLVRDWAARRYLVQRADGFFELSVSVRLSKALPPDVEALCRSRVEGAIASAEDPQGASEALAATTLAGQDPPTLVVRSVSPGGLDALLATGLVRQRGWRLAFEYGEVQRAAATVIGQSGGLADLHRRLAEAWAGLGRRTGADVDLPHGLHRLHADQADQAVEPLLRAAKTSMSEGRARLALDAARLAAHAADRAGTLQDKVEARIQQAEAMLVMERIDDAIGAVSQARKVGKLSDRVNARLQVLLARAALFQGAAEQANRLLDLADATLHAARDRDGLASSGLARATLYRSLGYWEHAVTWYRQVIQLQPSDPRVEVEALKDLIECRIAAGQMDGLTADVARLRQAAAASGDTRTLSHATYAAGRVHLLQSQLDDAERHFRTAQALAATLGADSLVFLCQAHLGEVFRTRQQDGVAADFFAAAARFAEEHGWVDEAATTRLSLALVALRGDEERRAYLEVDRASQLLHDQPQHWAWALVGLLRALAAARLRDPRAAMAWWQVARERGVDRVRGSPELWHALQRLAHESSTLGLPQIAAEALALAAVPTAASVVLQPDGEDGDDEHSIIDLPPQAGRPPAGAPSPAPSPGEPRMSKPNDSRAPDPASRSKVTFLPDDEDPTDKRPARAANATFVPDDDSGAFRGGDRAPEAPPTRRKGIPPAAGPSPTARGAAATYIPDDDTPLPSPTSTLLPDDLGPPEDEDAIPRRRRRV